MGADLCTVMIYSVLHGFLKLDVVIEMPILQIGRLKSIRGLAPLMTEFLKSLESSSWQLHRERGGEGGGFYLTMTLTIGSLL